MKNNLQHVEEIYVFCPMYGKGIKFYNKSPSGNTAKLTGSLTPGIFWSSGEKIVEWSKEVNGIRDNSVPVNPLTSIVVDSHITRYNDGTGNCKTIMVSEETFIKLLYQIDNPKKHPDNDCTILDFGGVIVDTKNIDKYDDKNYKDYYNKTMEKLDNEPSNNFKKR